MQMLDRVIPTQQLSNVDCLTKASLRRREKAKA